MISVDPYIKTPYCTIGCMYVLNAFIICDSLKTFLSLWKIEQFGENFVTTCFECFEKRSSLSIVMTRYLKPCFSSILLFFMNVLDTAFFLYKKHVLFFPCSALVCFFLWANHWRYLVLCRDQRQFSMQNFCSSQQCHRRIKKHLIFLGQAQVIHVDKKQKRAKNWTLWYA